MLQHVASVIELLALSGTYRDQPGPPPGSVMINQTLKPVTIRLTYADATRHVATAADLPQALIGDLLARTVRPDGSSAWSTLRLLTQTNRIEIYRNAASVLEFRAMWPLELVMTPLAGFPLAQYPFFRDPFDPLAHFAAYCEQYFADVEAEVTGGAGGPRRLRLNAPDGALSVAADGLLLALAYRAGDARQALVVLKFPDNGLVSVRRAPAGTFGGDPLPREEDLSAVSCRDNGAVKRWRRGAAGHEVRIMASSRALADIAAAATAFDDEAAGADGLLDAALDMAAACGKAARPGAA
jgi:hypothetical protein